MWRIPKPKGYLSLSPKFDTNAALIVIDLQGHYRGGHRVPGEIIGRTAQLSRALRERGRPVVLVNVTAGAPGRTDDRVCPDMPALHGPGIAVRGVPVE